MAKTYVDLKIFDLYISTHILWAAFLYKKVIHSRTE